MDRIPELLGETADQGPSESGWHGSAFCVPSRCLVAAAVRGDLMPRQKSLLTVIRDLVQQEVRSAIQQIAIEHRRRYGYRRISAEL